MLDFLSIYSKKWIIVLLLALLWGNMYAQRNQIFSTSIASLQVVAGTKWLSPPLIWLNEDTPINISFDDKTHQYRRYTYELKHCDVHWKDTKSLFTSDFISGFATDLLIGEGTQSINTNTDYTHYEFSIPNESFRITKSGNYKVTIFDETEGKEPVITAFFMVAEPMVQIVSNVTSNTDKDINGRHQQVSFEISYPTIKAFNPSQEFIPIVTLNNRWDTRRVQMQAQMQATNKMIWNHCADLIFDAGNEFRKFELLDVTYPSMGIEQLEWKDGAYHAFLWVDVPRLSYVYDEDANGAFYIRNSDNYLNNITSDYINVHFTLKIPRSPYDIYLNGRWTNDWFISKYKMNYDEERQSYVAVVPLKQGYYSYQYVENKDNGVVCTLPSEGSFYETENKYQIYIYYKGAGDRYTRLVGFQEIQANKKALQ